MSMPKNRIKGETFLHKYTIYAENPAKPKVHIYIDGDGLPWLAPGKIAADPTATADVIHGLIANDRRYSSSLNSVIYLGRPCYHQTDDPQCHPRWWTDARYSNEVVDSMVAALRKICAKHAIALASPNVSLVLIGYSGGGTIATLMASRMQEVDGLVTFAANLDIDTWSKYHDYSNLRHSLNPVDHPISSHIKQLHLSSMKDRNVPPNLNTRFFSTHSVVNTLLDNVTHGGNWHRYWPGVLWEHAIESKIPQ